ncbi:MAG: cell wall hydrolase [Paracoccaceae bacterium]
MKRFGIALAMVFACVSAPAMSTEFDDGKLIARGDGITFGKSDGTTSGKGVSFKNMLSRIKTGKPPQASDVQYTFQWIDAQPMPTGDAEFKCLAEALYFEARGETVRGQFAVAEVIVNRARSSLFPDTVCGVISQGNTGRRYQCQFTYKCDGYKDVIAEKGAYARVSKVARAVLDGHSGNLTDGATYYHTNAVRPSWSRRFTRTTAIGVHYFYRRHDQRVSTE